MDASIFSTCIKLDTTEPYPVAKIAKELFNSYDIEINQYDDSRTNNLTMLEYKNGIILSNYSFNSQIMREHNKIWIDKLYHFFKQPECIVSYMISDFNGAAGYTIINNGNVMRSRYFDPQGEVVHSHDIGESLKEEKEHIEEIKKNNSFHKKENKSFPKMHYTDKSGYYH